MKYTKEERIILKNSRKNKDAYSYIKEAIEHFTIDEIKYSIKLIDKRANFEKDDEKRRTYRTIIKYLKDLYILRLNNKVDDYELSKNFDALRNIIDILDGKIYKTELDKRNLCRYKKILREAGEIDLWNNEVIANDNINDEGDYDYSQYNRSE